MWRRLPEAHTATVAVTINGKAFDAHAGDSVAAALIAAGVVSVRTSAVSAAPRAPYCMMGVCLDCVVTIDGAGHRQACLVPVRAGMRIETQHGARAVDR